MAFDISALESVASQHSLELATKAITGAATAKLLIDNKAVEVGVKGSAVISQMDSDIAFQSAAACSARTPFGSTKLSNKRIIVTPIKDQQNICVKALYNTYFAEMIGKGQDPAQEDLDAAFVQSIINYRTAKLAGYNEIALWQGDTGSADQNLNQYEGILDQLEDTYGYTPITPSGADTIAKLQSVFSQSSVLVRHMPDFRLFMGQDTYDSYISQLAGKNLFRPETDMSLWGTTGQIFVAPGLNGTNKVVAGRIMDFRLGIDGMGDADKVSFLYSMETQQWYMDIYWAIGIVVVFPEEVGVATVA